MTYTAKRKTFLREASDTYGYEAVVTKAELTEVAERLKTGFPYWITNAKVMGDYKVSKGKWKLPSINGEEETVESKPVVIETKTSEIKSEETTLDMSTYFNPEELIPKKDPLFVAHGHFSDLTKVLKANKFYPVFETGESGTGKTYMTEQACAKLK